MGRRGLVHTTNIVIIVLVAGLAVTKMIVMGLEQPPIPALFVVALGLTNAFYLRRNGSVHIAAWILVVISMLGFATGSFNTGGLNGLVILLAPIIPVVAILLIDSRAALISLCVVCLILAGLYVLGLTGIVPENHNDSERTRFGLLIVLTSLCVIYTWVVWSFSSMTRALVDKLDRQSNTDYLTGALNRRGAESALSRELARARRTDTVLSLIMADVDLFKLYNDNNGHQAGDKCLVDIANIISSCCERSTDVVARYGGEEFVLILPDTDSDGAHRVAENIRSAVVQRKIFYDSKERKPVSLTLGVVTGQGPLVDHSEQLVQQADQALYRGKNQGRNCVVTTIFTAAHSEDA